MGDDIPTSVRQLSAEDGGQLREMLNLFGEVFEDTKTYCDSQPSGEYLRRLLRNEQFIAITAADGETIVGGLAAYELVKFEQERSEIYIYDLAVASSHRRQGIATAMIEEVQRIASAKGAWVVFVQADHGDDPPIDLYSKFGKREDVLHFDIPVPNTKVSEACRNIP